MNFRLEYHFSFHLIESNHLNVKLVQIIMNNLTAFMHQKYYSKRICVRFNKQQMLVKDWRKNAEPNFDFQEMAIKKIRTFEAEENAHSKSMLFFTLFIFWINPINISIIYFSIKRKHFFRLTLYVLRCIHMLHRFHLKKTLKNALWKILNTY